MHSKPRCVVLVKDPRILALSKNETSETLSILLLLEDLSRWLHSKPPPPTLAPILCLHSEKMPGQTQPSFVSENDLVMKFYPPKV